MTFMPQAIVSVKPPKKHLFAWAEKVTRGRANDREILRRLVVASVNGVAVIGQDRIANQIGISRRTVIRAIARLEKAGHITVEIRYNPRTKKRTVSSYTLNVVQRVELSDTLAPELSDTMAQPLTLDTKGSVARRDVEYLDSELEEDTGRAYPLHSAPVAMISLAGSDPLSAWCVDGGVR